MNAGNHLSGSTSWGRAASGPVVDPGQRSRDHANLFPAGSGYMPSTGASDPTLTLAALHHATSQVIIEDLR